MSRPDDVPIAIGEALDPVLRAGIAGGTAKVTTHRVPGLPERAVWRVLDISEGHPRQAYVGVWPDGKAVVLNDDQDAFLDLVTAFGVEVADPRTALGYVLGFLEVTRGPMVIVMPISDTTEIPWRPGSRDEAERREAFLAAPPIRPASVESTAGGFHVEVWLVVNQRIQLNTFDVARSGAIAAAFRVVAADLPLPIAR